MSAGGSIAAMITSMKTNSRRKDKHTPFSANTNKYKKGKSLSSKEMTDTERVIFQNKLKTNRETEKKQQIYKLIITLFTTIFFMAGIVFLIKKTFF